MELRELNRRGVTVVSKPTQDLHRPYAVFDRQVSAVPPCPALKWHGYERDSGHFIVIPRY